MNVRTICSKIAATFRRTRLEQDFEEEVQSHLARLEQRFASQGMSAEEARYAARRAFGGIEQLKELWKGGVAAPIRKRPRSEAAQTGWSLWTNVSRLTAPSAPFIGGFAAFY